MKRKLTTLLLGLALAGPVAGLADAQSHRFYDRDRRDYHEWNDREDRAYRHWLQEQQQEMRNADEVLETQQELVPLRKVTHASWIQGMEGDEARRRRRIEV